MDQKTISFYSLRQNISDLYTFVYVFIEVLYFQNHQKSQSYLSVSYDLVGFIYETFHSVEKGNKY